MYKLASRVLGILAAALVATAALGQSTRPLDNLSACRLDEARVALRFTFEGGACQVPGAASLLPNDSIGDVTVPTQNVGEVCTMQIVPVEFDGVIEATEQIISLDITVLSPEGQPQALGSTDVTNDENGECEEPEVEATE